MSDSFDFVNAHHAEKRSPYARPGPIPDSRLNIFHLDHAASIVRRATSSESSTSTSAAATSCGPKDTTGPCERYASNTSDATLPIVLGVLIPLGVAFIALIVLHRMHVRKLRREDAEDRQKSLDFGIVMSESEKRNKHNKNKKGAAGPEMSIADTTRAARGGRGVSMDLGTSNPYMLPPGLHHSRESLHSLSRALQSGDDKYASVDFIPDDGSMRSVSRQRQNPDDASSHTSSNKRAFDTQSTKGLLMSDTAKSDSDGRLEVPLRKPAAAITSTKNGLLAPAAPDGRESIVSTTSSNGAFRKSNDYLGAYIRGGEPPARTTESPKEVATTANDAQPKHVLQENDARLSPPAITSQDDSSQPQRPERPVDLPRFETDQSDAAPHITASGVGPKLPELRIPDSQSPVQDGQASKPQRGFEPAQTGISAQNSRPRDENTSESFPAYDSPSMAGPDGQRWEGHAPGTHGTQYVEEDDYYDPGEDYGNPYDDYQNSYDPRWVTPGMRPLPPDDPSENPEQRANRIRSFYKEYFDESGKGPHGGLEGGYYEDQAYGYNYQHAPSYHGPGGRQRATFSNGSQMPGPRAFSSASGRYGNGMGPRPQPQPRAAEPKKRAPPPKALSIIPTPSKLKDDTFIIDQSIDFAPPLRAVMQRSGTPDSGRGGSVPFSPTVRAHVPLASSYDDLAVMPSPHMLRKSGTFTALDFAPPRFRGNQDSMSDAGSIRSARSGTSLSTQHAIRAGAYRVSRIPKDVVGTQGEINNALRPQWDMR
ncbi:hypothetical protein DV738_g3448, partial [Chaetothyriales sp. CBS 135597]